MKGHRFRRQQTCCKDCRVRRKQTDWKTIKSNDIKSTEKVAVGETPVFDFPKLMSQFRLPGVSFAALVDRERKNIEALAKANRIAFEGWQRLVRPASRNAQETMKKVVADAGQEGAKRSARISPKRVSKKALANMRELSGDNHPISERGLRRGSQEDRRERGRHPKFWKKAGK